MCNSALCTTFDARGGTSVPAAQHTAHAQLGLCSRHKLTCAHNNGVYHGVRRGGQVVGVRASSDAAERIAHVWRNGKRFGQHSASDKAGVDVASVLHLAEPRASTAKDRLVQAW